MIIGEWPQEDARFFFIKGAERLPRLRAGIGGYSKGRPEQPKEGLP